MSADDEYRALVEEFAPCVTQWEWILENHTRTPDGYCAHPQCGRPGTGTPYISHPCPTRVLAHHARELHRESR